MERETENANVVDAIVHASVPAVKRFVVHFLKKIKKVIAMNKKLLLSGAGIVSKKDLELALSSGFKGEIVSRRMN